MKKSEYAEQKWKFSQMDPDYITDILGITSLELLEAFPNKFEDFLNEDYESEEEEERYISRSNFE